MHGSTYLQPSLLIQMPLRELADATLQGWVTTKERGSSRTVSFLGKRIQELGMSGKGLVPWTKWKLKACSPEINKKIGQVRSQESSLGIKFPTRSWLYQEKRVSSDAIRGPASWRTRQMAIWQYVPWWCSSELQESAWCFSSKYLGASLL